MGYWELIDSTVESQRPIDDQHELRDALEGDAVAASDEEQELLLLLQGPAVKELPEVDDGGRLLRERKA